MFYLDSTVLSLISFTEVFLDFRTVYTNLLRNLFILFYYLFLCSLTDDSIINAIVIAIDILRYKVLILIWILTIHKCLKSLYFFIYIQLFSLNAEHVTDKMKDYLIYPLPHSFFNIQKQPFTCLGIESSSSPVLSFFLFISLPTYLSNQSSNSVSISVFIFICDAFCVYIYIYFPVILYLSKYIQKEYRLYIVIFKCFFSDRH